MFRGTLSRPTLQAALDVEIARTESGIATQLAAYDPIVTPQSWHRVLQGAAVSDRASPVAIQAAALTSRRM